MGPVTIVQEVWQDECAPEGQSQMSEARLEFAKIEKTVQVLSP